MPPLPPRLVVESATGSLVVGWPPLPAPSPAHVIVALRPLSECDAAAFWAGALDADLIRYPVEGHRGRAELHVPAGRRVEVLLVAREPARGGLLATVALTLLETVTPSPCPAPPPPPRPDLVLVDDVDLDALAARVAAAYRGEAPAPAPQRAGGPFGTRQRWYLTRLAWSAPPGVPLAVVRRTRFIDAAAVEAWRHEPPDDALPLPSGSDGLIDALTPEAQTAFYCVLAGPSPWRPVAIGPCPPPFDRVCSPAPIGHVVERLAEALARRLEALEARPLALLDLGPELALLEAAGAALAPDAPARRLLAAAVARWRAGPMF